MMSVGTNLTTETIVISSQGRFDTDAFSLDMAHPDGASACPVLIWYAANTEKFDILNEKFINEVY